MMMKKVCPTFENSVRYKGNKSHGFEDVYECKISPVKKTASISAISSVNYLRQNLRLYLIYIPTRIISTLLQRCNLAEICKDSESKTGALGI